MKLYDAPNPAPNPRRVRIFLAEKGLSVPIQQVSLAKGEQKGPAVTALNGLGQVPVLELDDGSAISESVSICRYCEALHPEPPLFGREAKESALIDMWIRRLELQLMAPLGQVWVNCHPFTERMMKAQGAARYPEFGEDNRRRALARMAWLDGELEGRSWIAGDAFSMADIVALTVIDFASFIGVEAPDDCARLRGWHERAAARPSAAA